MRLDFDPDVAIETADAIRWYDDQVPGLGKEFLQALRDAWDQISALPTTGSNGTHPRVEGVRRLSVERFSYDVYFEPLGDRVVIWSVSHKRRRPGYWLKRRPKS
jgi:plasmid stabilization system protein ParE